MTKNEDKVEWCIVETKDYSSGVVTRVFGPMSLRAARTMLELGHRRHLHSYQKIKLTQVGS